MSNNKMNKATATIAEVPYTTEVSIGNHTFFSDEPVDHGGADKGPRPHDLLLSALVSCTCITVKMYANRKEWPLKEVVARAEMERNNEAGIQTTNVKMYMKFAGDLNEEQVERLLNISGKCPVHKTLEGCMQIQIIKE